MDISLPGLSPGQVDRMFPCGAVMLCEVGSKSHGTWIAKADPDSIDDIDLMGVYVSPIEAYFGFGRQETIERKFGEYGAYDCVSYDLRHFVGLLMKSNPNVLGMLWMPPEHVLYRTEISDALVAHRSLFATKYAYQSFAGYARGQLHRMTHFDGPARVKMQQIEEELQRRMIPPNFTPEGLLASRPELHSEPGSFKPGEDRASRSYIAITGGELLNSYRQMCNKYTSGYMGKKRRELVEKFGYDAKNASHLLRLLKMSIEFLMTGELCVDRTGIDAEKLMEVKRGEWSLEKVQRTSDALFDAAKYAAQTSKLPEHPDRDAVESLLVGLMRSWFDRA